MDKNCSSNVNKCIRCSVEKCAYHCKDQNYCTLSEISVVTHEQNPTETKCTDCASFKPMH
ncbi:MAG: DUF1540 domain-containing protein [Clostridia bacterium]|nr:DUF1540 domain-containing protein [Clostridia bacterium]